MERGTPTLLRIGAWRVDPVSGELSRDGETVRLEVRTLRLLVYLAEHAGDVVSIDDLLKHVWSDVIVTPASVYQAVASLRRVLGDDAKEPTYIATVPKARISNGCDGRAVGRSNDRPRHFETVRFGRVRIDAPEWNGGNSQSPPIRMGDRSAVRGSQPGIVGFHNGSATQPVGVRRWIGSTPKIGRCFAVSGSDGQDVRGGVRRWSDGRTDRQTQPHTGPSRGAADFLVLFQEQTANRRRNCRRAARVLRA
jgi:hypothetical protein